MAPSQVSGMKMRNLLLGVILGLLAVVHSTPINTVTQIPTRAEDEVIREAVTDGFLVEYTLTRSLTTEPPKRNTTVQASQQPSSDTIEGSADGETSFTSTTSKSLQFAATTQSASHAQSSTSTVLPRNTDDSISHSSTTQSHLSSFTSSSVPNEAQSSITPNHNSVSQTTDPAVSSFGSLSTQSSDSGSGDGEMFGQHSTSTSSMTSSSSTETSTASSTETAFFIRPKVPALFARSEGSGSGSGEGSGMEISTVSTTIGEEKQQTIMTPILRNVQIAHLGEDAEPQNKGHSTPGWIIILGFVVGVAALVMLCVAIATRDKWNGPRQAPQPETKTNSPTQQRELEMETFLHKDEPRENGKAAEYTVIPLDELPEKYSSD